VTLVDAWPAHVEATRTRGLKLTGTQGEHTVRVGRALGYGIGTIYGLVPENWLDADAGNAAAVRRIDRDELAPAVENPDAIPE
jgi:hypothetical protein